MISLNTKKKLGPLLGIILTILMLSGCQQAKQPKNLNVPLPTVKSKYSEEERTQFTNRITQGDTNRYEGLTISSEPVLTQPKELPKAVYYESDIDIPYPEDGVKGVYVTSENIADEEYLNELIKYIDETELNTMVINFKDDYGNIVGNFETDNDMINDNIITNIDLKDVLKKLEEHEIYPIARIVTFKDYMLSDDCPEYSFHDPETGEIWKDGNGTQFVNPFLPEVWNYNIEIAIEAAKMGFKDIQFDYVRFPEGFETFGNDLEYDIGSYEYFVTDNPEEEGIERVIAISDFLNRARNQLKPYGVDVSADVFGYTAIAQGAPDVRGIGQDFARMSERVDVMSSMIYPSHWGDEFFDLVGPDMYPYEVVSAYMNHEKKIFEDVKNEVKSRPWLQDFTFPVPSGNYIEYGPNEVQAQINALFEQNIHEYLLWNGNGEYTRDVDYAPDIEPVDNDQSVETTVSNF